MAETEPSKSSNTTRSVLGGPKGDWRELYAGHVDRILSRMAEGLDYAEAVMGLRFALEGQTDEQFEKAWKELPIDAVNLGTEAAPHWVYTPSRPQAGTLFQLLCGLLARKGISAQRRIESPLAP